VLARAVEITGASARWPNQVLAISTDGPPAGSFLRGAMDRELEALAREFLTPGRSGEVVDLRLDGDRALAAGLSTSGYVRVLLHPASDLTTESRHLLAAREPICLVTDITRFNVGGPPGSRWNRWPADPAGTATPRSDGTAPRQPPCSAAVTR
jgi:xanthine/CO dehydrogenase XdhC/CoxF family maturation factor